VVRLGYIVLILGLLGCDVVGQETHHVATLTVPAGFDPIPIPSHNPVTMEKVALGERLFFDPRLSEDRTVSCASCHLPSRAFADPRPLSVGVHGRTGIRNSPSLVNAAYLKLLFWDGGAFTLESQALGPLEKPVEMDMHLGTLLDRIKADSSYQQAFQDVFGSEPDLVTLTQALATFQRTIRSGGNRVDAFNAGSLAALTAPEKRGKELFEGKAGCVSCHSGPLFSDQSFRHNGIAIAAADSGRARITLDPNDFGRFRVQSLRNIELTAPYMHDGRFGTLAEVVDHYDRGGTGSRGQDPLIKPLNLSASEKEDLLAFLHALTDDTILVGMDNE